MQKAVKAALLSGLVFPGAGQIYLKRYRRGLVLILTVLAALMAVVVRAAVAAFRVLEEMQRAGKTPDPETITTLATQYALPYAAYFQVGSLIIVGCWIFSIIDAYRIGKKTEIQNRKEDI